MLGSSEIEQMRCRLLNCEPAEDPWATGQRRAECWARDLATTVQLEAIAELSDSDGITQDLIVETVFPNSTADERDACCHKLFFLNSSHVQIERPHSRFFSWAEFFAGWVAGAVEAWRAVESAVLSGGRWA